MKKATTAKPEKNPALTQEFPARLTELEVELRLYPSRPAEARVLKSVEKPTEAVIDKEKVVQFTISKKKYAIGHSDVTYPGSNHARGVRHIRFFSDGKAVLDIEGDFEDQQFGSNFRFQNMDAYVPGDWEPDFLKLTDEFRHYKEKRRSEFHKKRSAERRRLHRSESL